MPLYRVLNSLKADQVIQDSRGKGRSIPGGGSLPNLDLNERQIERYRRFKGLEIQVQDSFETSRRQPSRVDERRSITAEEPSQIPQEPQVPREPRSKRAAALLVAYKSEETPKMDYATFVTQAKEIMGNEWPGGTPKKSRILDLLQVISDED